MQLVLINQISTYKTSMNEHKIRLILGLIKTKANKISFVILLTTILNSNHIFVM